MQNTIYIEGLKLNKNRLESISEISKYLLTKDINLKFFIASGEHTIAACMSDTKFDYEQLNSISNYINNNPLWKR